MKTKINKALEVVKEALTLSPMPVVLSSFGKDSMVMLQLVKEAGFKFPIIFFREAFESQKYTFANQIIQSNNYTVYDYPPTTMGFIEGNGSCEVINYHSCNYDSTKFFYMPTGIKKPVQDHPYLCALHDVYYKPKGTFNFPWNTLLIGHKASDIDPIFGSIPPKNYIVEKDGQYFIYPILDFTDEDIWAAHELFNIPIHSARYNGSNNFKEHTDISSNPDYFYACTKCMTSSEPVYCDKYQREVPSSRASLNHISVDSLRSI